MLATSVRCFAAVSRSGTQFLTTHEQMLLASWKAGLNAGLQLWWWFVVCVCTLAAFATPSTHRAAVVGHIRGESQPDQPTVQRGPCAGLHCVYVAYLFTPAGSHTVLQLLDSGYSVVIMDNLRNSFPKAFEHMQRIAGDKAGMMKFVKVRQLHNWLALWAATGCWEGMPSLHCPWTSWA